MTTFQQEISVQTETASASGSDWLLIGKGARGTPYRKISVDALFTGRPVPSIVNHGTVSSGAITLSVIPQTVNVMILGAATTAVTVTTTALSTQLLLGMIIVTQDGSGLRTITWPASFRWQGGFSPSLSTAAGATDVIQIMTYDGGITWLAAISLQVAAA